MKVILLAGGQGTRLREETEFRPKPLVEVGGRPVLWHIMKLYAHYGHRDFVVCLGYRGNMIKEYFLNYEAMNNDLTIRLGDKQHAMSFHGAHDEQDYCVTLASTGLDAMTGSRVKQVQRYVDDDTFMVTYGDGVSDIDIDALLRYHRAHGKIATLSSVKPHSRFGVLQLDDRSFVESFSEKPQAEGWVNAGYFVFDRRVFDYLRVDLDCILEREPLEQLAREGQLAAYQHEGFWFAMDTYREYQILNELWSSGKAPWAVWRRDPGQGGA